MMRLVLVLLLWSAAAHAQPMVCTEREALVDHLNRTWDEDRIAVGLSNDGGMMEVFASPDGTWTVLITFPNGQACIMDAGVGFDLVNVPGGLRT